MDVSWLDTEFGRKFLVPLARPSPQDRKRPPKDFGEFESRLLAIVADLDEQYGIYGLRQIPRLGREKCAATLARHLREIEQDIEKKGPVFEKILNIYEFLKTVLEQDAPLSQGDIYLLGVQRDRSGLSKPQKNMIAVQCAAQVLWLLKRNMIPNIETMEHSLLDSENP